MGEEMVRDDDSEFMPDRLEVRAAQGIEEMLRMECDGLDRYQLEEAASFFDHDPIARIAAENFLRHRADGADVAAAYELARDHVVSSFDRTPKEPDPEQERFLADLAAVGTRMVAERAADEAAMRRAEADLATDPDQRATLDAQARALEARAAQWQEQVEKTSEGLSAEDEVVLSRWHDEARAMTNGVDLEVEEAVDELQGEIEEAEADGTDPEAWDDEPEPGW